MDVSRLEDLVPALPKGAAVWAVSERDPLAPPPDERVVAAFLDRDDAEHWAFEAHARRPWFPLRVQACNLASDDVARTLQRGPDHPTIDPERRRLRQVWRSRSWPSSRPQWSAVWLDAIDDELVWLDLRHERDEGDIVARQPVSAFLWGRYSAGVPATFYDEIIAALREHRAPDADRDPTLAARRGALGQLRLLLERGASIEHRDRAGRTPLAAALVSPDPSVALFLSSRGASLEDAIEHTYGAPARPRALALTLDLALRRRWFDLARVMVERGAPVDDPMSLRPWEIAFANGAPSELLRAMRARGATFAPTSRVWASAGFLAAARADPELAALSPIAVPPHEPVAARPPLPRAPQPSSEELERRARAAARGTANRNLGLAVAAGNLVAIDVALASGASAQERGHDGQLPLHHASRAPEAAQVAVIERLLSAGAIVDARDAGGGTALGKSVRRGALPAVTALLAAGADPRVRDDDTPLVVHAVLVDSPTMVELLLAAGASPAETDSRGRTALQVAREKRKPACEAVLVRVTR